MKLITLTQGKSAMVDDEDYEWISKFIWYCNSDGYATRNVKLPTGKRATVRMHRVIMDCNEPGMDVDHLDGSRTNNQRSNLRICTRSQNIMNTPKRSDNTTGFKGVSLKKENGKFFSTICIKGCREFLGYYNAAVEAAIAYDDAALELHGEFSKLNFPFIYG